MAKSELTITWRINVSFPVPLLDPSRVGRIRWVHAWTTCNRNVRRLGRGFCPRRVLARPRIRVENVEITRKFRSILEIRGQCGSVATKQLNTLPIVSFTLGISFIWIPYFYWVILRGVEPMWRRVTGRDPNVYVNVLRRFVEVPWSQRSLEFSPHERAAKRFVVLSQLSHEVKNQENPLGPGYCWGQKVLL